MVHVPEGEFLMGSTDADEVPTDEKPAHTVYLDAFWIDKTEVTNARYARFLNAIGAYRGACGGHDCVETKLEDPDSHIFYRKGQYVVENGFEKHPVIEVTWYGAQAYCQWAGARLPTEAEWEKAARGVDGRLYPWGNDAPDCDKAQHASCDGMTVPAGSRPAGASPYGALDMAGNVWEWVADWYDATYYDYSPTRNPQGAHSSEHKVFRGGSWGYLPKFIRTADRARNHTWYAGFNIGFRCGASVPFPVATRTGRAHFSHSRTRSQARHAHTRGARHAPCRSR
jgi:formylglycine-generating enzyme required for sulfatase activity